MVLQIGKVVVGVVYNLLTLKPNDLRPFDLFSDALTTGRPFFLAAVDTISKTFWCNGCNVLFYSSPRTPGKYINIYII
jgi:hypothetical protein